MSGHVFCCRFCLFLPFCQLEFGNVPTTWYILFFIILQDNDSICQYIYLHVETDDISELVEINVIENRRCNQEWTFHGYRQHWTEDLERKQNKKHTRQKIQKIDNTDLDRKLVLNTGAREENFWLCWLCWLCSVVYTSKDFIIWIPNLLTTW